MKKGKFIAVALAMVPGILVLSISSALAQGLTHNVTGSGEVMKPATPAGTTQVFRSTVSAREDADGRVWGVVIVDLEFLGTFEARVIFHNQVTCLDVDGSSAWIGGVVTNSTDESMVAVGDTTITLVRDWGGAGEDFMDGDVFPNDNCEDRPLLPGVEVEKGNYNVF